MEAPTLHRSIWILVGLHFLLATLYAFSTPYREGGRLRFQGGAYAADIGAPDERQHINYVRHLLDGKGFPVLNTNPGAPDAYENYQSHQPPTFYILAAGVGAAAGNLEERNGGLALRLFNALIGSAGVLGVYGFALWSLRRNDVALLAAAFAALLPMNVALSGAVSNDPLLFALCSWVLALAAKGIQEGFTVKLSLAIGALMGIAFLTKTTAIALWPAVALGFYLSGKPPLLFSGSFRKGDAASPADRRKANEVGRVGGEGSGRALPAALLLALPFVLALPWWLRNQQLYGDPLGMKGFTAAFVGSPQAADFIRDLGALGYWTGINEYGVGVGWWTLRSLFGVFGYMDIFWPSPLYAALLIGLAVVVLARLTLKESWLDESRTVRLMGGVFFLVIVALFLRFNAQYFQGQARYLLPAIAPISVTVALGIWRLSKSRPTVCLGALVTVLLALNIYTLTSLPGEFERRLTPPPAASR